MSVLNQSGEEQVECPLYMPVLLEPNPGRRERPVSCMSEGLPGEPRRLHSTQSGTGGRHKDGEEGSRAEATQQDAGVEASARERSCRAEQPGVRGGTTVVINQSPAYAGSQSPSASAYVTYVSSADALRAIQAVNNVTLDGRVLKGSLGTTKYCANFMKNQPCDPKASFTKEEMHAGLHQVYERRLHQQLINSTKDRIGTDDKLGSSSSSNTEKSNSKDVTASQINSVSTSNEWHHEREQQ
ncbi:unnamed protein product [Leptidea sinapis]|uniref:RRM domain-containing protein n=1 Tax=Leptidea sinapis TaxID=189913 RepID=A0A5E4PW67_9NEOP|nr:unnamed protein product [Leptidea sinapis]